MDRGLLAAPVIRTGPPRGVAIAAAICAIAAAVMVCLPWHTARDTHAMDALQCVGVQGDCKAAGEPRTDTGLDHTGPLPLILLGDAALVLFALALTRRRAAWMLGGAVVIALFAGAGADVVASNLVTHALNDVRTEPAAVLGELLVLVGATLAIVATVSSRRIVPVARPPALPRAVAVRR